MNSKKDHLTMKLSETMNCRKSEVIIREEGGEYRVSAPLKNIVACSRFFGNIGRREQSGLFGGRILSVKNLIITIAIVILMSMLNAFQLRCFEIMR